MEEAGGAASVDEPSTSLKAGIIRDGDNVVLDANGYKSLITVKRGSKVKVGKFHTSLDPIIGQHYGVQFELGQSGRDLSVKRHKSDRAAAWSAYKTLTSNKDNSQLQDNMLNQTLTTEQIEAMKEANMGGDEIVTALLANSGTFETKTEYSQEKYLKRKTEKYTVQATVHRVTARSLTEALFSWRPEKIQYMRADTLAMLLTMANIGAHGKALVLDGCGGLVTGAVAERMGGFGQICSACTGLKGPATEYVRYFNFPPEVRASIKNPPLSLLLAHRQQCLSAPQGSSAPAPQTAAPQLPQLQQLQPQGAVGGPSTPMQHANGAQPQPQEQGMLADRSAPVQESAAPQLQQAQQQDNKESTSLKHRNNSAQPQQQPGATLHSNNPPAQQSAPQAQQQAADNNGLHRPEARYELGPELKQACSQGFNSCILASPSIDPTQLLRRVMPLLAPSASFALFSNWLQPLADCMFKLQTSKEAVALQLNESWWREYQVLPGRTHPEMMTSGTGGYVLSGIKVCT